MASVYFMWRQLAPTNTALDLWMSPGGFSGGVRHAVARDWLSPADSPGSRHSNLRMQVSWFSERRLMAFSHVSEHVSRFRLKRFGLQYKATSQHVAKDQETACASANPVMELNPLTHQRVESERLAYSWCVDDYNHPKPQPLLPIWDKSYLNLFSCSEKQESGTQLRTLAWTQFRLMRTFA